MSENKTTTSYNNTGNFSYSFNVGQSHKTPTLTLNDLLVLDDVNFSPVSNDAALVVNSRTDKMIVISSTMATLVQKCDAFRTIEQHVLYIKKLFNLAEPIVNELKNVIDSMNSQGMFLSAEMVKTRLLVDYQHTQKSEETPWVLGVGSCDRPELLERMLNSATPHLQDYSPKPEFIFVDDSRQQHNREKNHQIVSTFCAHLGIELNYWDRDARTDFTAKLSSQYHQYSQSIQWLLNPDVHGEDAASYGLGKNFIQLHTQHKPLIMLDDDCIVSPINRVDNEVHLHLSADENRFTLYTDMDTLLTETDPVEMNPFKLHLDQLNTSFIESILTTEESLYDPKIWSELERDIIFNLSNKDYVGMTTNCVAGAQNSRHMDMLFIHSADVVSHEEFLKSVLGKNEVNQISWRGTLSSNLNRNLPFICTTMSGLAASDIPVFTFPVGRNEDMFLGEFNAFLENRALCYQFNWALPHLPEPKRTWNPQESQTSVPVGASTVLRKILNECSENCPFEDKIERLEYFAYRIESLVQGPNSKLKKYVTDVAVSYLTNEIFRLENIANDVKHHTLYLKGVRQLLESRKQELMQILNSGSIDLIDEFVGMATPMGKAFRQWPKIIELAQQHI